MKALLAPLIKISNQIEEGNKVVDEIHSILSVDLKRASIETHKELKAHTVLLGEIRDLLKEQHRVNSEKAKTPAIKMPGILGVAKAGFAIVVMAGAIVAASGILSNMAVISPAKLISALAIGGLFTILAPIFVQISESLRGGGLYERIVGKLMKVGSGIVSFKQMMQNVAGTGLAMISMSIGIAASSHILKFVAIPSISQIITAGLIGLVMTPFAYTFNGFARAINKGGFTADLAGLKKIGMTTLAMVIVAGAISGMAWALQSMPPQLLAPPELYWIFSTGIMMWIFSNTFAKVLRAVKGLNLKQLIFGSLAIPLLAFTVVGIAWALSKLKNMTYNSPPVDWTLKVGLALFIFSLPFTRTLKAIKGRSLKDIAFAALALPLIMGAIIGTAYVLSNMPTVFENAPPVSWTLKAGLALFVFSLPFVMTLKAVKGSNLKQLAFGALALPLIAAGILGTAWVFNYLSEVGAYNAPPVDWTLKAGLAMAVFGIPFILTAAIIKKAGIGFMDMIKAGLSVVLIAGAILATAWIFSFLPGEYVAPPMDWVIGAGLAIGIFAIPFLLIGIIAKTGGGAAAIGLGALGMILIAGTMWVVAWIFSKLPDLSAISKNFTDAIMYPINSMIDALNRFKNEIGIENMWPLAGGLLAIAGGWLALTAALAGSSIGGVLGAAANVGKAIFDGISKFFGGDAAETPISLLDKLIGRREGIEALAKSLPTLGGQFAVIAAHTDAVVRGIGAFMPFLDEDNSEYFTDSATAAEKLATAYQKIGKATETMNVEAIKESRYMFEALTRLAEADGEDALTVFAEKLMVAVEELSSTVENLQNAVGEQSSGIKDVIGGLLSKVTEKVQQVTGNTENAAQNETSNDMSEVVELLSEIEERLNRPLRIIAE